MVEEEEVEKAKEGELDNGGLWLELKIGWFLLKLGPL